MIGGDIWEYLLGGGVVYGFYHHILLIIVNCAVGHFGSRNGCAQLALISLTNVSHPTLSATLLVRSAGAEADRSLGTTPSGRLPGPRDLASGEWISGLVDCESTSPRRVHLGAKIGGPVDAGSPQFLFSMRSNLGATDQLALVVPLIPLRGRPLSGAFDS